MRGFKGIFSYFYGTGEQSGSAGLQRAGGISEQRATLLLLTVWNFLALVFLLGNEIIAQAVLGIGLVNEVVFLELNGIAQWVVGGFVIVSVALFFLVRANHGTRFISYALVVGPIGIVTVAIHFAGTVSFYLVIMYPILTMLGRILYNRRLGLWALGSCVVFYGGVALTEYAGVLPYGPIFANLPFGTFMHPWYFFNVVFGAVFFTALAFFLADLSTTRLEKTQKQLVGLDELKSQYLSVVSHDLRTPMTSIAAYAGILEEEAEDLSVDERRKFAGIIGQEAERLTRMVSDLLDLDKIEAGKMTWDIESHPVEPLIEQVAAVFKGACHDKEISLATTVDPQCPAILCDRDRMVQVLANLVSNAVKFTPVGGEIKFSATRVVEGKNQLWVQLGVDDGGPGVPADMRERIFDRFQQVKGQGSGGSGLGLTIAKEIVRGHNGRLHVEDSPTGGSLFLVHLPTTEAVNHSV